MPIIHFLYQCFRIIRRIVLHNFLRVYSVNLLDAQPQLLVLRVSFRLYELQSARQHEILFGIWIRWQYLLELIKNVYHYFVRRLF